MKFNLIILLIFIFLALSTSADNWFFITPIVMIAIYFLERNAFRIFFKWKFILFLFLLAFGVPLYLGEKNAVFLGFSYSTEYFYMSLVMVNRSLIILLSVRMFTGRIGLDQISKSLHKIHLYQFSETFHISIKVLPEIKHIALTSFREFRQMTRHGNFVSESFNYSVKFLSRILHFAQHYNPPKLD